MKYKLLNPLQIKSFFVKKTYLRKKITVRLMPYAIIFAVIVVYTLIGNSHLLDYSENLSQITEQHISASIMKQGVNANSINEIRSSLLDNIGMIHESSENFRRFIFAMFIVITILLVSEFLLASKGINSMDEVVALSKKLADGDLTQDNIDIVDHKELHEVGNALNQMRQKLGNVVVNVSNTVDKLTSVSDNLLVSSETISEDTQKQIASTGQVAGAVEMMSIVVYDVTRNSANAAKSAKEAADLASRGGAVVAETINGMNRISQSVHNSAGTISVLGERSEQIGEIIKVINDIANQTNLLALNAAIEAARAGEQGRGFAVVADEVRKLAERTTSATNEIGDMIKSIQEETRNAVSSMESATKEVEEGADLASQADESLKQIMDSVQSVMDMVQQIAESAKQQSSTGEDVSSNLQEIANENQKTAETAHEYYGTTRDLNNLSRELQSLVSHFEVKHSNNGSSSST
jgi:methyl-accepting chemotaxis protein